MKFTHQLDGDEGWVKKTYKQPKDFKKVEHLGKCFASGDMFVAYDTDNFINIYKGIFEEQTLKTNTWYVSENRELVYRTRDTDNYAICLSGEYNYYTCKTPEKWKEATQEEVEEALIKLAKKKGFKNVHQLKIKDPHGEVYEKGEFSFIDNKFMFIYGDTLFLDGVEIFNEGKWAEILEDEPLSIEERLKRIEEKLNI